MPDLIRHPPSSSFRLKEGRWTPDQVRGDDLNPETAADARTAASDPVLSPLERTAA